MRNSSAKAVQLQGTASVTTDNRAVKPIYTDNFTGNYWRSPVIGTTIALGAKPLALKSEGASGSVRMKDIARDLGLSVVTVSKVFRGHRDISAETRKRVLEHMARLNYRPNLAARSLATGRSFTMAFIAPDLIHPFFSEIAKHLSGELRSKGYYLLMASSEEDQDVEAEEIERMLARRVDVLVLASCQHRSDKLQELRKRKIPVVLVDRNIQDFPAHFVGVDDELAGRLATKHLIEQGRRSIAHISSLYSSTALGRMKGYREELEAAGLPFRPEYCMVRDHGDDTADETGYRAMKELLNLEQRPDAVFCNNDPTAIGAMKAILNAGFRIPQDVAVVGCGNIRHSDFLRVPLTTIDQNSAGIGLEAAKLALSLTGSRKRHKIVLLEPQLVVRESSVRQRF
jgi:LacI family transcriptional regulator